MITDDPVLLTRCRKAAGSWPAAVLLYRIIYWQPRLRVERGGHKWFVRKSYELQKEVGLTPKEYENAIKQLKLNNLIVTETHFFGATLHTYIRITERALLVKTPPNLAELNPPEGANDGPPGGGDDNPSTGADKIKEILQGDTTDEYQEIFIASEKTETGEEQVATVKELILSGPVNKKKAKPQKPSSMMEAAWKQAMKKPGKYVPELTIKQKGQLTKIYKACPGNMGVAVLTQAVENWGEFAGQVKANQGLKFTPLEPAIGFLLSHIGEAVNFGKNKMEPAAPKGLVSKPKAAIVETVPVKLNSHEKMTPEQLAAILSEDDE